MAKRSQKLKLRSKRLPKYSNRNPNVTPIKIYSIIPIVYTDEGSEVCC